MFELYITWLLMNPKTQVGRIKRREELTLVGSEE
jgi:hypothetical protein